MLPYILVTPIYEGFYFILSILWTSRSSAHLNFLMAYTYIHVLYNVVYTRRSRKKIPWACVIYSSAIQMKFLFSVSSNCNIFFIKKSRYLKSKYCEIYFQISQSIVLHLFRCRNISKCITIKNINLMTFIFVSYINILFKFSGEEQKILLKK